MSDGAKITVTFWLHLVPDCDFAENIGCETVGHVPRVGEVVYLKRDADPHYGTAYEVHGVAHLINRGISHNVEVHVAPLVKK